MLYRALGTLAAEIYGLRGDPARRQRLLRDDPPGAAEIWLHGASLGELTSARPLIERLARDRALIVTANSLTGRDMVRGWGLDSRLAPFDAPGPLRRFLDAVRPKLALTVENELWPGRSAELARRGIPQIVIGARLSARSAARWSRLPWLIGPMLDRIGGLSAQDADSEARLLSLGLRSGALLPRMNLKLLGPAAVMPPPDSPLRDRTILAASTHEGEDAPLLDAYAALLANVPDLRLILAPRHPDRADAIAALIAARGLGFARRSLGGGLDAPLLLADSLGEMGRWYDAAGICFVGGSLVDKGGHTPWEPAAHCCAILHGPFVANAAGDYATLDAAGGAEAVEAGDLARRIAALHGDPARRMGRLARGALDRMAGDPAPLLDAITAAIAGR